LWGGGKIRKRLGSKKEGHSLAEMPRKRDPHGSQTAPAEKLKKRLPPSRGRSLKKKGGRPCAPRNRIKATEVGKSVSVSAKSFWGEGGQEGFRGVLPQFQQGREGGHTNWIRPTPSRPSKRKENSISLLGPRDERGLELRTAKENCA